MRSFNSVTALCAMVVCEAAMSSTIQTSRFSIVTGTNTAESSERRGDELLVAHEQYFK